MRVREENCNMILLATITLVAAAVAGGATLVEPADSKVARLVNRTTAPAQPLTAGMRIIPVDEQPPARVVGAPFVPNTNPRER